MHQDRIAAVADAIEASPEMYTQRYIGNPGCGTPGCILGWAITLYRSTVADPSDPDQPDLLGLTDMQADQLYNCQWIGPRETMITPTAKEAVETLRWIADKGRLPDRLDASVDDLPACFDVAGLWEVRT